MGETLVNSAELDIDTSRITITGVIDEPGTAFQLFYLLAGRGITVDTIMQTSGKDGQKDISFTISRDQVPIAKEALRGPLERDLIRGIECDEHIAKIAVKGENMASGPEAAVKVFEAMFHVGINIKMITTAETRIAVLVDEADGERGYESICRTFGLPR